ncbi:MAG TPA: TonB-dependent receptor [Terracidiphilus sp.]|nr:TonB-dependent receptor [Terracidiphilus sp.]
MRFFAWALFLVLPAATFASTPANSTPPASPSVQGVVADPTGAIVPGAEVDLVDPAGTVQGSAHSGGDGSFQLTAPHAGSYTLVVSEPGFETVQNPVVIAPLAVSAVGAAAAHTFATPLRITLPIAAVSTNVRVNADSSEDLTAPDDNHDSSVLSSNDLKAMPIFDNDYATAMSAFLDDSASGTGGSGLVVDGVEANRATVSPSAVQEVHINQDPYSAQYYWPGRGQMEIITKSAADRYHGQFNFLFRDSALNAQNALATVKPFEQRRVYEGHATGPISFAPKSSFLATFNRAEEDLQSVVSATVAPTPDDPTGTFQANVPAPARDTEFSLRAAHQFGDRHSGYVQYSFQNWTGQNQGVGNQTLASAGVNQQYREDDFVAHLESTLSAVLLNQISLVGEHDFSNHINVAEAPHVSVSGDFSGGSAQNDSLSTENNFRLYDMVTWTRGRHLVKAGIGIPHIGRRAFDDNTNALGTYTFGPTLAADGVTVLTTALQNFAANRPSGFSQNTGDVHFVYHQQEAGAFIQDQFKLNARFSITPGLRYDWQNFLATRRLGFAPRVSFAWVLDPDAKVVVRGGGGVYYDRFGSGPLLDLVRYENARRRSIQFSFDPAQEPATGCVPVTNCETITAQPPNLAQLAPHAQIPYQMQYGLSIERQLGEHATGIVSVYSARGIHEFRSVDVNAPTPDSGYSVRPDPAFGLIRQMQPAGFFEGNGLDISYRGRFNKYFSGFGRYTWSHYESNTGGIGWFPQNQYAPNDEWSNAGFDRRQRLGVYAMLNRESIFNLSTGIFANTGRPWTIVTGTDAYGDSLFNTRPDGVARDSETAPSYVDLDLRWGHDFAITPNKADEAPRLGFSAAAFNILNHENPSAIDTVQSSPDFGDVVGVNPPRRIQMGMRFEF